MKQVFIMAHDTARRNACEAVKNAPEGHVVTIGEPTRTLEQNAAQWPILEAFSEQLQWPVNGRTEGVAVTDQLPAPLTPADCDLRTSSSCRWTWHACATPILASDETPEACWAAVLLWSASWHRSPPRLFLTTTSGLPRPRATRSAARFPQLGEGARWGAAWLDPLC